MTCPNCQAELEFESDGWPPRWNTKSICPSCTIDLLVDYDFIVLSDGDEWNLYNLIELSKSIYANRERGLDFVKLKIDD